MSDIDSAINRLQALALQISSPRIKAAPEKPISDAAMLPLSIAHIARMDEGGAQDATSTQELYTINVDFHVAANILKTAYTQIDAIIPAYTRLLAGDPTLNGAVDTIIFPVSCDVLASSFDAVEAIVASFAIPIKVRAVPTTSTT